MEARLLKTKSEWKTPGSDDEVIESQYVHGDEKEIVKMMVEGGWDRALLRPHLPNLNYVSSYILQVGTTYHHATRVKNYRPSGFSLGKEIV